MKKLNRGLDPGSIADFPLKIVFLSFFFAACTAPATKLKCAEIQYRLDHQTLSDDEKRVLEQEVADCGNKVDQATQKDSIALKKFENHLSPQEPEDSL